MDEKHIAANRKSDPTPASKAAKASEITMEAAASAGNLECIVMQP